MSRILTVGHSVHAIEHLVELLRGQAVTAVADVRSVPASRFSPHFNKDALRRSLAEAGIGYVFLGRELGARSDDPSCYVGGKVQYARLAAQPTFAEGIDRVLRGARSERVSLLCAEEDPLDCHRTVLVARVLVERGADVAHVRADGSVEPHDAAMKRLMESFGITQGGLLESEDELLAEALARQEDRIAYVNADAS